MKTKKTRLGITLTQPYIDALEKLVKNGLYLEKQDAIRDAMRDLFKKHGIALEKPNQ